MQDLFEKLAWKCRKNSLNFYYNAKINHIAISNESNQTIAHGSLEDYPMEELRDMLRAVDEHLMIEDMKDEEFITGEEK